MISYQKENSGLEIRYSLEYIDKKKTLIILALENLAEASHGNVTKRKYIAH